jgi:hypothetical protein
LSSSSEKSHSHGYNHPLAVEFSKSHLGHESPRHPQVEDRSSPFSDSSIIYGPGIHSATPTPHTLNSFKHDRLDSGFPMEHHVPMSPLNFHKRNSGMLSASDLAVQSPASLPSSDPFFDFGPGVGSPIRTAVLSPVPRRPSRAVNLIHSQVPSESRRTPGMAHELLMRRAISPVGRESAYEYDLDDAEFEHDGIGGGDSIVAHHRWRCFRELVPVV